MKRFTRHHRRTFARTCWALVLALLLANGAAAQQEEAVETAASGTWKAGAARVLITPEEPMWMAGYGSRTGPSEGKLTELWAKALVLEDATGRQGVLITLDLVGIDRSLAKEITSSMKEAFGYSREAVMIATSHTHTGPVVGRNLAPLHYLVVDGQQQQLIDDYAADLQTHVIHVVDEARKKLRPCSLGWGNGTATFAVNRRNNPAAEVPLRRTSGMLVGPTDHDVPVLAMRNEQGDLVAVVFGYACHATVLSRNLWSGDYPGYAQQELEKRYPQAVALFYAGCGADQNPLPRRSVELAEHYGRRLAEAVDTVLMTSQLISIPPRWSHHYREIDLPLAELPARLDIESESQSGNKFVAARARMLLEQWDAADGLANSYPYPIGVWSLGDEVDWVFLGGEVVVDYAIRLKAERSGAKTWVAGYANDVMAYIPSRRVLNEGGYEGAGAMVYYGLPTKWAPEVEEDIVRTVHELAN